MDRHELRNVALGIVIALLVLSLITEYVLFIFIAIVFLMAVILDIHAVYVFANVWQKVFSKTITYISNAVLAVVYIIIYTPYGAVYRFFNKKKVNAFLHGPEEKTSFYTINKEFKPKDFENPW